MNDWWNDIDWAGADGESLGSTLGAVAALIVWLFGLVAVLQVLGPSWVLAPSSRCRRT